MPLIMKLSHSLQHQPELAYVSLVIVSPDSGETMDGNDQKNRKLSDFISRCFFKSLSSVRKKTKMFLRKRIEEESCFVIQHKMRDNVHSSTVMNSNTAGDVRAKQDREEGWRNFSQRMTHGNFIWAVAVVPSLGRRK